MNSSGGQGKKKIYSILDPDLVEYTLYYTLPKFYCIRLYGGGAIQIVVVAHRG